MRRTRTRVRREEGDARWPTCFGFGFGFEIAKEKTATLLSSEIEGKGNGAHW